MGIRVAGRGTHPLQPRVGSCLTLTNELSEETHELTKQEALSGSGAGIAQPRWLPARRILGGSQDRCTGVSCLLLSFPEFLGLVSSVLLTRTSCYKATHTNGYCGTWSGWEFQSELPLTRTLYTDRRREKAKAATC